MTPAAVRDDPDDHSLDRQIERHMGCMAGFLQLFDRPQILAGKRIYAAKRISSPSAGSTSPSERSDASFSSSSFKPCPSPEESPSSPESRSNAASDARVKPPVPIFDMDGMRSSWKMREAPRLSLDSRAVVDGRGKLRPREIRASGNRPGAAEDQRRSPSVVARLMGLDALPGGGGDTASRAELRRSASESRVSRDLSHFRFVDPSFFQKHSPPEFSSDLKAEPPRPPSRAPFVGGPHHLQRKSFFDAQDFYPEPKRTGSLYDEIERRLRMRGINEPARDLETLKQVLEVLQLKGLLHEQRQQDSSLRRRSEPPIVVMKPSPRPPRRPTSEPPSLSSRPARRNLALETASPTARSRRAVTERNPSWRSPRPPDCNEVARSPSSSARRRQVNAAPAPPPPRRSPIVSTSISPRTSPRRTAPEQPAVRSPRNRRSTAIINPPPVEDDASTTVSGSSISNSFDYERTEEYRSGRSLLERCDKLLHSIAAITSSSPAMAEQQPSPVSVLDSSSFLGDESSPSPITPRSIDFKDQSSELEDEAWRIADLEGHVAGDVELGADYVYVAAILRGALDRRWDPSDVYARLEKRYPENGDVADTSRLHRRMLFDTVVEILDRKRSVHPWDAFKSRAAGGTDGGAGMRDVWAEVRRAGERVETAADYLNDMASGAMRKDTASGRERGWGEVCPAEEMSEAVLYIERQIFKDLVGEAIRDLADVATNSTCRPRRKLVF